MKHIPNLVVGVGFGCLGYSVDLLVRCPGQYTKLAVGVAVVGYLISALGWWLRGRADAPPRTIADD